MAALPAVTLGRPAGGSAAAAGMVTADSERDAGTKNQGPGHSHSAINPLEQISLSTNKFISK